MTAATGSAHAALSATLNGAEPVDTSAMAYSNFNIDAHFGSNTDDQSPRSLQFDLPKGQLGAVQNATVCTDANFNDDNCAASSKIGDVIVNGKAVAIGFINIDVNAVGGVYRLATTGTEAARIGIVADDPAAKPIFLTGTMRVRDDYGITAFVGNVPNTATADLFSMGVDVDISRMRMALYGRINNAGSGNGFMFNPAECIPATTVVRAYAGTNYAGAVYANSRSYTPTNCAGAPYNPSLTFGPAGSAAATATAFNVNVSQPYNPTDAKVGSPFKKTVVTMPPGISLTGSTKSDATLAACTDAQFSLSTLTPTTCPTGSRVGSVVMDSPLVGALNGDVYLAQPAAGPNDIIRLFMVAQLGTQTDAVRVKLLARVEVDPATGVMTASLDNLPAQPVKSFSFTFRTSPSQAVRQPRTCGTFSGTAALTSYSSATAANRTGNYVVNANCGTAGRFNPTIGMVNTPNTAGSTTTGVTTINIPVGDEAMTSTKVSLPPGMIALLNGQARCTLAQVTADTCAAGTAVGSVAALAGQTGPGTFNGTVYLTDAPDSASLAGLYIKVPMVVGPIVVGDVKITAKLRLRTDFGVDVIADVPAAVRGIQLDQQQLALTFNKANFLVNPPVCTGNTIAGEFGSAEGSSKTASSTVAITGCASMAFQPTLAFSASPAAAGGASAFTTTITQPASTASVVQSPPKTIAVTLPDGVSLSPSANSAGNLVGCADAQFTKNDFADPTCPAGSIVGDATIQTPSIGQLTGKVYLGTAVSGHTARILLDAKSSDYGARARVKLEGFLDVNETTGATTATFTGIPPVNFTSFVLALRGGTNPVLSMPRTCGTPSGSSVMTPHSGTNATPSATLTINANCGDATSFAPTFATTFSSVAAGATTTMTTTIGIPERHRALDRLSLNLPAGLLANLAGAPRCTIPQANASTCPAATKIGDVSALAGQGTTPGTFSGSLYLTDAPAAGDAVGIAVDLPAVVGPVDLGRVVTIASARLRPADYGIDIVADVPTAQKGVPLHLRQLGLKIDKAGFLTNPVTCAVDSVKATLRGQGGSTATPSVAYQATGCGSLTFNPSVAFSASPQAAAGASAFSTSITAPAGSTALKKAVVDLPTGVSLSPSINSGGTLAGCTAAQFGRSDFVDPTCPAASDIGDATIVVPQVGTLSGDVYLASATPSGAIAGLLLDARSATLGAGVRVKLEGRVDVDPATGKTTATFDDVPSVAFTSFTLAMRGGTAPALSMPRTCGTPSGAAALTPHAGAAVNRTASLTIDTGCGNATSFGATGAVSLSSTAAAASTSLTTTITVPTGHRELSKVAISLPAGMLANIDGKARCSVAAANAGTCAAATEVGTVSAQAGQGATPGAFPGKVYLVDAPTASDIVGLAISIPVQVGPIDLGKVNVVANVRLRSDYGIDITADVPTHVKGIPMYLRSLGITVNRSDFLFNPSTCGTKTTAITMTSASYGGASSSATSSPTTTIDSCGALAFNPTVAFSATPAKAGGSGALTTKITLPASPAQGALKAATVQLPAGVSLSPSIDQDGTLSGCTAGQFDAATPLAAEACPATSRIGTAAIQTGSVGALTGDVYLAAAAPGHLAGVYVTAGSANFPGARVKLTGLVDVDESTGATTAVFADAPPVPFTEFSISFRGGTSPALSLPRTCGTPQGTASLTSHANATATRSGTLTIDQNCGASTFTPSTTVTTSPTQAGNPTTLQTKITLPEGSQELNRVRLSLPAGLVANIDGHQRCSIAAANAGSCAAASKIGTLTAKAGQGSTGATYAGGSVYLTDAPGAGDLVGLAVELPAKVGTVGGNAIVDLGKVVATGGIRLRTDYGIDIDIAVPTKVKGIPLYLRELNLDINESGFMVNPAACSGNAYSGTLNSAQSGSSSVNGSLSVTGCSGGTFNPAVAFSAAPARPAASAAFTTTLTVPSGQSPVKTAAVTLPEGVSLSASANAGGDLVGCTAGQFDAGTWADPTCPAGSKVGTVTIDTPSVGAVNGDAYITSVTPNGAIAGLYVDAKSVAFGTKARIKISGKVAVDGGTGATVATFDDLPGVAFKSLQLTLRGGSSPVVSLPRTCGTFLGSAVLTPHVGSAATRSAALTLNQSCPEANQFGPQVDFDLSPNGAGQAGKLTTTISVPGGDQELSKVRLDMPEGLTAKLHSAPRCTIAQAQADACAAGTEIGSVVAKVGVDGAPYPQSGKVYLTEGRSGNVAGMAIILPAVVGPIDLGKVITIADVQLKSPDLALQITADVPTTVKGVRLDLRELKLAITKDDFLVNPSSCGTLPGDATFTSKGGRSATDTASITIPAGTCATQNFDPQISFGAGNPKPGEASDFTTSVALTDQPGPESPFKNVTVRLPEGMSLSASAGARGDLAGCTDAQFKQDDLAAASSCPAGSEIGTVKFETGELAGDLNGKVFLAPATNGNLARIFLETTSSTIANLTVRLIGKVQVNETTGATDAVFDEIPAIPVTKFTVTLRGGDAPTLALPRVCGTANGTGTFVPVSGGATQTRNAGLVLSTGCPDPNAFAPTVALDRSTSAAGQSMAFTTTVTVPSKQQELSSLKMVLPAGLLGNISQIPACSITDAKAGTCGEASKVGDVTAQAGVASAPFALNGKAFLVKGDSTSIARLAIVLPAKVGPVDLGDVITIAELKLRADYGLTVTANEIPTRVKGVRVDLSKLVLSINKPGFMVNPVSCNPATGTTTMGSLQGASQVRTQDFFTTGCDQLKLNAGLAYNAAPASPLTASQVTTHITASASGGALDAMKTVRVTMPEGLSLSPSAGAKGDLAECAAGAFNAGDIDVDAACPAGSKVGTVSIDSPMIGTLTGDVFLGAKTSGHFAGIFLQAKADEYPSLRVKLAGQLDVNEADGRLTATFSDLPQVQVSAIHLSLRGGDAPVVSLPRACGTFGADVNVLRHGGGTSDATGALVLDQNCPDPGAFAPSVELGASPTQAGADTSLTTTVKVPARQQELRSLEVTMPRGLLGRLTVAPKCSLDAARANGCGDGSLVGSVRASVGVASAPYRVDGKVYLTDGDGALAGLMFALPARVGPIDLGTVVTLAKIDLVGNDLRMKITATDIPTRVKGIPLNIGEMGITIDKPGMVVNATACGEGRANASFGSAQGGSSSTEAGYAATGCEGLNWQPSLKVGFSGPPTEMAVKGHPTLTTVIEQAEGQGNLSSAVVTMPTGVATDLKNVNARSCASPDAAVAGQCPESSQLGAGEIVTSALPNPVKATLYMVKLPNATLPGVAIHVRDQISFDIIGTTKLDKAGRLVASFTDIPDTPISKMTLVFNGGSTGVLQLGKEICGVAGLTTDGVLSAHHGASKNLSIPVDCNGKFGGSGTAPTDPNAKAFASATFRPSGSSTAMTFALSNPNGISKLVLRMPKGAIFTKTAYKKVKLTLTGAKAKTNVVNGERRMAISIKPNKPGEKVTKVKFKLPNRSIRINYKIRRVLTDKKTSKKKKAKILAKLLSPSITVLDGAGNTSTVKLTVKVAAK